MSIQNGILHRTAMNLSPTADSKPVRDRKKSIQNALNIFFLIFYLNYDFFLNRFCALILINSSTVLKVILTTPSGY